MTTHIQLVLPLFSICLSKNNNKYITLGENVLKYEYLKDIFLFKYLYILLTKLMWATIEDKIKKKQTN